jgi:hypothetical protein
VGLVGGLGKGAWQLNNFGIGIGALQALFLQNRNNRTKKEDMIRSPYKITVKRMSLIKVKRIRMCKNCKDW